MSETGEVKIAERETEPAQRWSESRHSYIGKHASEVLPVNLVQELSRFQKTQPFMVLYFGRSYIRLSTYLEKSSQKTSNWKSK